MPLATIFAKPINRPIEGVIKADDEASLKLEVEEYVLTNEVAKRLETFLAAYTHYEGANGVWVSGFFGSGKSHLLKTLALLLENRVIDGVPVLDLFLPKCGDNEILRGDLKRAVAIPSKSILFNIDQKADIISKTQVDALLAVFVKVFDEMGGYYGKQGHIAQFERDLDSRGLYGAFREAFRACSGLSWEAGREQALLEAHHIAEAYAQVTGVPAASAASILDNYRGQYRVSIEDFAEQVAAYIARQGPEFRLNFFVDEVGQYIAENTKLMTNLQTIAESLATKCRGRAWLVVTAQEDMETVVGEMSQQKGNDFSKIQARFGNRMKLTSTDVAEVIRRRLLLKNERGIVLLSDVYADQQNNLRTLFGFGDGAPTYRSFRNRDDFIHTYPFIPYQFVLFQSAIQNLSVHNAFEGKHSSVGERSMLGVFQQVAMRVAGQEIGQLATFDLMFEGVRTALKANIQRAVLNAEQQLDNPLAIQVLKALFLVKYIKEFKATLRNLSVLMLDRFDADVAARSRQLQEALDLLEQQTYIQRNGDQYEYLTDEEKDVEQEIKNTEVEAATVADELVKFVFDLVIKDRKIRYDDNGQDYAFSRKLDDTPFGREYEIGIHVISPFHEHAGNLPILRMQSMGRDELLVVLPVSERLVRDLLMYKRTEKYIRQNITVAQQDSIKRILTDRQFQNRERYGSLRKLVEELLSQATLVVSGQDVEVTGTDAKSRIVRGFHELLVRAYPNLRMLRGINYTEADIANSLQPAVTLFGGDAALAGEAEAEMFAFVEGNNRSGLRTTLLALTNRFESKPYGWYLAAIQCMLAKLCVRGKIEVWQDANILEGSELGRALRNTQGFANVILAPQIDFTAGQVRQLKEFYAEFFDGPAAASEAKALGQETAAAFVRLRDELGQLQRGVAQYPFLAGLAAPIAVMGNVIGKPYAFYLTELRGFEDDLFAQKEQVSDPIRRFMGGAQKQIYEDASLYLKAQEPNFSYVEGDEARQIRVILDDPAAYQGNRMAQVKSLVDALRARVAGQVDVEKVNAARAITERWERLTGMAEFGDLTADRQAQLKAPFDALARTVERQTLIAVIRDTVRRFDETGYQAALRQMTTWARPAPAPDREAGGPDGKRPVKVAEPPVEYVARSSLQITFGKARLADEQDVNDYVTVLKEALMAAIRAGKRVQM